MRQGDGAASVQVQAWVRPRSYQRQGLLVNRTPDIIAHARANCSAHSSSNRHSDRAALLFPHCSAFSNAHGGTIRRSNRGTYLNSDMRPESVLGGRQQ